MLAALVTGGARDIGRAIVLALAQRGVSVVFSYLNSEHEANETLALVRQEGGTATAVRADVTKQTDVDALIAASQQAFGGTIQMLINNAGGLVARKKIDEMDETFWNSVLALNLTSVFLVTKAALPLMPNGSAIVNLCTQAARDGGGAGAIAYASAKAGVMTFTRGLAKELGGRRIRVNAVAPGMINTGFHDTFTKPEVRERVAAATPLGREGEAQEVAALVAFLASEAAAFINGATVDINGGTYFS
jgi:3-oxoacyl-[acyl-carrier protein] reductase